MKKLYLVIALICLGVSCRAGDLMPIQLSNGAWLTFYDVPEPTSDLVAEYLWASDDATDTSTYGNDGAVFGTTYNALTNGLGAYRAMGATGTVVSTISQTKTSFGFYAKTNTVWRYYEDNNGVQSVDLASEAFTASEFYDVTGTTLTIGGADHDINTFAVHSISNTALQSVTNRNTYAVKTGIRSEYVNKNLADSLVFMSEANTLKDDGSTNSATGSSVSAPTIVGEGTNNAHWAFNGIANENHFTDTAFPSGGSARTFATWVKVSSSGFHTIFDYGTSGSAGQSFFLYLDKASNIWYIWHGTGQISTSAIISIGAWNHITIVCPDSNIANTIFYINGIAQAFSGSGTWNTVLTGNAYWGIRGSSDPGFPTPLTGGIDQAVMWDYALSSNQVFNLSQSPRGN